MQLYPAIDLKDGKCVRLTQGSFQDVKIYADDPLEMAKRWVDQGASYLHLVDLDGALAGYSINQNVIERIVTNVAVPVQIGGGIRTAQAAQAMLETGASRVIIGTKAVENPDFIGELIASYGRERIVVGIDAKDGRAAIGGWETVSEITALELCMQMKGFGVSHIVYTDISKDGMLCGPNISSTRELTEKTAMNIIASGGVSCLDDLIRLSQEGIHGVIIGKALYENKISLAEAIRRFEISAV